jgi:hypothetical protein
MRIRSILSHSAQAILEGAIIATLVVGLIAGTAFAARGGPVSGTARATLSASPSPAQAWASYRITGCGYVTGQNVNLVIQEPAAQAFYAAAPDGSGCIASTFWADGQGTYTIKAYQHLKGTKQTLMGATTLAVE